MRRKGIILAGGSGTRLFPLTHAVSKQLMPVYDKPMIYYPLSVLMLAGIREILVITTPADLPLFQILLRDGAAFGLSLQYATQPQPEGLAQAYLIGADFIGNDPSCLILGDNLFYGANLVSVLAKANRQTSGATIFGHRVAHPSAYGVVEFDAKGRAISLEEKPLHPKSDYAIPGIYFYDQNAIAYAAKLKPSARGELEITDLNRCYLERGNLHVEVLGRGIAWLDTGTPDSLLEAAEYVQIIQHRQGLKIACLEEIAYERQWITREEVRAQALLHGRSSYADYLHSIIRD
jgi:glucose-1-phosphate thymidylyltransferase